MILCMCRKGFASSNQLVRLTSSGSQGGISTLGPCEPRGRQVSWVLWVAEEAPVSPASWGLSSGCTGAPLLAQLLSSPRLLIPFRMAPPSNKARGLGSSPGSHPPRLQSSFCCPPHSVPHGASQGWLRRGGLCPHGCPQAWLRGHRVPAPTN